jgi:hypothetical protein
MPARALVLVAALAASARAIRTDLTGVHLKITSVHDGDGQYINMLTPDLTTVTSSTVSIPKNFIELTRGFSDPPEALRRSCRRPACRRLSPADGGGRRGDSQPEPRPWTRKRLAHLWETGWDDASFRRLLGGAAADEDEDPEYMFF